MVRRGVGMVRINMYKGNRDLILLMLGFLVVVVTLCYLVVSWLGGYVTPAGCANSVRGAVYLRTEGESVRREHLFRVSVLGNSGDLVEVVSRVPANMMPRLPSNQAEICRAVGLGE